MMTVDMTRWSITDEALRLADEQLLCSDACTCNILELREMTVAFRIELTLAGQHATNLVDIAAVRDAIRAHRSVDTLLPELARERRIGVKPACQYCTSQGLRRHGTPASPSPLRQLTRWFSSSRKC